MKLKSAAATHVGKIRTNNEDNYFLNGIYKKDICENIRRDESEKQKKRNIYAVCDGVGGEEAGERASLLAVETLSEHEREDVLKYIENANKNICCEIKKQKGIRMGSTLALLKVEGNKAETYNVGDSRIYIFREGKLKQLSKDHTRVQQMVDAGILSRDEIKKSKERHVITQHLGIFPYEFVLSPYVIKNMLIKPGDIFLLCSDGLTDMLEDDEIRRILSYCKNELPIVAVNNLILSSLDKGGKDNITVIIVKVE